MGRSSSGSPQRVLDAQKAVDLAMNRLWNRGDTKVGRHQYPQLKVRRLLSVAASPVLGVLSGGDVYSDQRVGSNNEESAWRGEDWTFCDVLYFCVQR